MRKKTLPRLGGLGGSGWAHPYGRGPFSPFLYADGGDGDGSGSGSGGADGDGDSGDGGGSGDGGNSGGGDGGQGAGGSGKGDQGKDGEDDAAKVKRLEKKLTDARAEAGKARTDAKKQAADDAVAALTKQLGKALGFVKDDAPPDPKALADAIAQKDTALSQKDASLRAKDVELAVWSRADKLKAKAGALLDSRSFVAAISELDPSDKGFQTDLDKAIKDAVDGNKAFAVTPPAGKSGADLSGGTGEGAAKQRGGSLSGAIANHYGN
ncbi:hypothetical protein PV735_05315 [Streptomyces turgidiscabies]|uniref:Uncharacterized protein n=1 Tax=Streptomyces turgidiscabies (strain Car8) TaxID=698760 RepID=L7F0R4_STRT8|nr:hypothetical protein [Streptomyces turgidiscabies]ELP64160.1 hypothetical protein STRTUCAR8_05583 [Streptomyces turgidiscabies Car8]MDX3492108.1 hypothetical protein [Streptomyces turgidiscabies]